MMANVYSCMLSSSRETGSVGQTSWHPSQDGLPGAPRDQTTGRPSWDGCQLVWPTLPVSRLDDSIHEYTFAIIYVQIGKLLETLLTVHGCCDRCATSKEPH